ncbi:arginine vasopressin-induced protein 1 [Carettochelys insculpta]|uniref:arginine vasopressin-induced protein 1 n=1 Tax=Carettochelys insculpta TaxID=44489 RepID=UPI003EBBCB40
MGTPASVACDAPRRQAPAGRARAGAAANIFQHVGLRELRRLFRRSGDERAEERAQLVWERAGGWRQLRPTRRGRRPGPGAPESRALQLLSFPRLEDGSAPAAAAGSARQPPATPGRGPRSRQRKKRPGPAGYLHQLQP